MASLIVLSPNSAEFPTTNYPFLGSTNNRPTLAFDATTNETCYWSFIAPNSITGTLVLNVYYMMATATSGDVDVDVLVEAISDGENSADSFDTANSVDNTTVPATAGIIDVISVTLTNKDGIAAGDLVRIGLRRDAASDTATGDMLVLAVELQDGS